METQIDFVVTWLDASDPEWQKSYAMYSPNAKSGISKARFREMDTFRYWFRAVERYAPWVHKVFLVTNGKFPDWINKDNPQLVLVKHEDFMPEECLPTFNSCAIELHLHKIKGLSEQFVYFNDDVFLNAPIKPSYYFKEGLPCDMNKETCFNVPIYTPEDRYSIYMQMIADLGVINGDFNRWRTVLQSPWRWFGLHLGIKGIIMSGILLRKRLFVGFSNFHLEQAFLKSVFDDVWDAAPEFMEASCTRFRTDVSANPYVFRYWQFAKNLFYPMKRKGEFFFLIKRNDLKKIKKSVLKEEYTSVCLNDSPLCSDEEFTYFNEGLQQLFEKKFPIKSSYEL